MRVGIMRYYRDVIIFCCFTAVRTVVCGRHIHHIHRMGHHSFVSRRLLPTIIMHPPVTQSHSLKYIHNNISLIVTVMTLSKEPEGALHCVFVVAGFFVVASGLSCILLGKRYKKKEKKHVGGKVAYAYCLYGCLCGTLAGRVAGDEEGGNTKCTWIL